MTDIYFMHEAIKEAKKAFRKQEVPVGCVIVVDNQIVARAHNLRHTRKNSLYHAEMIAIQRACRKLDRWILDDATIYVTLEPCLMCTGAILQSRLKRLVYGKNEPKFGCIESIMQVLDSHTFNHRVMIEKGICEDDVEQMMKTFFRKLRTNKRKEKKID